MLTAQFVWFNRKYVPTLRSMRMHINQRIDVKLAVMDDNNLYHVMMMFSQRSLQNKGQNIQGVTWVYINMICDV